MIFYPNNEKIPLQYENNFLSQVMINGTKFLIFGQEDGVQEDQKKNTSLELILLSNDIST